MTITFISNQLFLRHRRQSLALNVVLINKKLTIRFLFLDFHKLSGKVSHAAAERAEISLQFAAVSCLNNYPITSISVQSTDQPIFFRLIYSVLSMSQVKSWVAGANVKHQFQFRFLFLTSLNIYLVPCAFCFGNFFMIIFVLAFYIFTGTVFLHKFPSPFVWRPERSTHTIFLPLFSSSCAFTFISIDKYFFSFSVALYA